MGIGGPRPQKLASSLNNDTTSQKQERNNNSI
jgi:hypothetical protein